MIRGGLVLLVIGIISYMVLSPCLFALDPERRMSQYILESWDDENGLPQNSVYALLQTSDGYLWLGTEEGLIRFDGIHFTTYDDSNTEAITNNYMYSLFEDNKKRLWIGTRGGGLLVYENGTFKRIPEKIGLSNTVFCVYGDADDTIWFGTLEGGLYRLRNDKFESYTKKDGLAHNAVRDIYRDKEGRLWIATMNGLSCFKEGKFTNYYVKNVEKNSQVNRFRKLCMDSGGNLWLGSYAGLFMLRGDEIVPAPRNAGCTDVRVLTLREDRDKNLWIGTTEGLIRYRGGKFAKITQSDGLTDDFIVSLAEDREGNLWVGTVYGGLNRLRDGKFLVISPKEGLADDVTYTIMEDRDNYIWVTTNNGLNRIKGERILHLGTDKGLTHDVVNVVYQDRQGFIWAGTDNGLNKIAAGASGMRVIKRYKNYYVLAIQEDSAGTLWIGTNSGLFKREKPTGKLIKQEGLESNHINVIYEDRGKNLWVSTYPLGLSRIKDGKITLFTKKDGMVNNGLNCLSEDEDGVIWIGTIHGLSRFKDGTFTNYTKKNGLHDNNIYKILDDRQGNLWMTCNKGIFRISRKELNRFAEGKRESVTSVVYGKHDGMRTGECNGGFQSAGCRGRDGRLWFPTSKGVVSIDPSKTNLNPLPPPVFIEQVTLDGEPVTVTGDFSIPPEVKRLEFHYAGLSYSVPQAVRFKYRLEGFDDQWVNAGTDRTVSITKLLPGDYRFHVTACNNDGVWNVEGASIAFEVIPPIFLTTWFILAALTLFAILSYLVIHFTRKFIRFASFWKRKNFVGKFKLLDKLGTGGMGTVFRAQNLMDRNETVAVKVLKEELFDDELNRKRFKQEAAIVDQLDHPNIVKVYERGQTRDSMFIAMELLEGRTLTGKLMEEKKGFDIFECLHIMVQVTDAIAKIHSKGIIHRDLKPDNIMLIRREDDDNFVKVLDFGLARMEHQTRLTQSGMVIGTINYMAPEQITGSNFSPSSDVYSLGVIFFELLTGGRPFHGESTLDIMRQIMNETPDEPIRNRFDIPSELNELVMRMMDKDGEERPGTEEVLDALERIEMRLKYDD